MRLLSLGLSKLLFLLAIVCLPATAASAATKHVDTGNIFFTDVSSNTTNPAITTINVGDTVQWDWVNGTHTVTSGTCVGASCSPDGLWESGQFFAPHTFSRTFNSPGTFPYYCIVHGSIMQGTVIVTNPADFTVSISDPTGGTVGGPIFPGQQTVFDGTVAASNGFNSAVSLSCQPGTGTVSPCTPSPASATPAPMFSFTITAGAATPGHYSFAAQGTDGISLTHSFPNLNFDVVDFGIAAPLPSSITAFYEPSTSASTSSSVTLSAVGNLPNPVSLACESNTLPPGATCNFAPAGPYSPTASVPVSASASITVPAATTAQDYNVVLDVSSSTDAGSATKTQGLLLHVVQFTPLAFAPPMVTIGAGNISNSTTTHLTASTNFLNPGTVTLACTAGLPAGGICNFPNNGVVSSFPFDQSVAVSVPFNTPAAAPTTLTVTATGNSGGASFAQNQSLTLNIPAPALSLGTPSPTNVTMVDHSFSAPVTVQITPTNLAGIVSLSCGSLPPGVTCRFSPSAAVNVAGRSTSFVVVFEANGAAQGNVNNITIQADITINGTPVSSSVGLGQLSITVPATTTNVSLSAAAVNSLTNTTLINVGDPNLRITASVSNSGSTYTAAVWEVTFSSPVNLVAASNPNCSQVVPTVVSCNIGDVAGGVHAYSFKVAPTFARTLVIDNVVTSPSVGDSDLTDNTATAPAVQIRPRPFARKGLVPKTP